MAFLSRAHWNYTYNNFINVQKKKEQRNRGVGKLYHFEHSFSENGKLT